MDDRQALNEYVKNGSQDAFRVLADRYVDLVYSSARRQVRDVHLADDVTQAVFLLLAQKAGAIPQHVLLSAWLYRATRYVCCNAIRKAARRDIHEQEAAHMKQAMRSELGPSQDELRELVDQGMTSLGRKDRDVLLLRYFRKLSIADVSVTLGISEEAARKRVARAVGRLSEYFRSRGITAPIAAVDAGLLAWAVETAPHAVHQAAAVPLALGKSATAINLVKGATFMMSLKTNLAIAAGVLALLVGGTTLIVVAAERPGTAAAENGSAKAQQLMMEGWQLWQQQKYAQAETRFSAAVKLDPKLTNAWNGLGWSQFNQGDSASARTSWEKVVALEPGHPAAENGLGWLYFNQNDLTKAEQHWVASAKNPDASASWSGLARVYLLQGKWDDAKTYAGKLVDSGDASAKPLLEAAVAQQLSDDLKKQISPPPPPTAASADIAKGWQFLNQNRPADAVAVFRIAVTKDPKDSNAYNGLGWALMRTPDKAEAQTQFEKAIVLDPDNGGAMNGLAMVLKKSGKTDQAIEMWKKLDAMNPSATNAGTYGLAKTYLDGKQYDKALPYLERLAKELPNDAYIQKGLLTAKAQASGGKSSGG